MSRAEDRNGTKFIWKIENFSSIKEQELFSPNFQSFTLTWHVIISISSLQGTEGINISLYRLVNSKENYNCLLAFLDSDGFPVIWKEKKNFTVSPIYPTLYQNKFTFHNFIDKRDMYGSRKTTILPNNTLTVQCLIWKTPEDLVLPLKCFARTRMEPNAVTVKKTFIWSIENVSVFMRPKQRVEDIGRNFASLTIKLSFNTEGELEVTFKSSLFRAHLKVKISMLNVMGKNIMFLNKEIEFKEKEEEALQTNITKSFLTFNKNLFLNQDTLSLQFTCTVSTKFTFHDMVNENEILVNNPQPTVASCPISEPSGCTDKLENVQTSKFSDQTESKQPNGSDQSDSILQVLQDMYEGFLSDCVLKIGSREYPIHKAVLGARSPFFKAMFTTNMKERDANCVDVKDVDEDTLQRLLRFVYLDRVEEQMGWESALNLYAAADMYAIKSLQRKCSAILGSGLCVSNVLQVLKQADIHQDQVLKSTAVDFISCNDSEIIGTQNWLMFEKENATLALETLRKLYLQKLWLM